MLDRPIVPKRPKDTVVASMTPFSLFAAGKARIPIRATSGYETLLLFRRI
jgi:hypothetical protein